MRKVLVLVVILLCGFAAVLGIRGLTSRGVSQPDASAHTSPANPAHATPGDRQLRAAQGMIEHQASSPGGYNLLAAAYMQKARESGDFSFNVKAEEALGRSFKVAPDNYDALKLRAKLLLSYHRFAEALEVARRAQAVNPRDHDVYGAMTDALVELGDYPRAVEAAQAMVDLRPDAESYSRISYLRFLHGDLAGAVEAMRVATQAASPADPEKVAWCLVHLGEALMLSGKVAEAEREFDRALFSFPDYPAALAAKGRARFAAGDSAKAVEFYARAVERVPLPEYAIALGNLHAKLGHAEEAKRQYDLVEFVERTGAAEGTYTRELALFLADRDARLGEALAIAERERAARNDIYTNDVLAWCLYKNGRIEEAKTAMDAALRLGTRDPRLLYHAGMIANALGDRRGGAKYLQEAIKLDPSFDALQADVARRTLAAIKS